MVAPIDITGQRFGRLVAVRQAETTGRELRWLLRCDCGGETVTTGTKVRAGYTKSCGCLQREAAERLHLKHGDARKGKVERLYRIWQMMHRRCTDPNGIRWSVYGGRGIRVCVEWAKYPAFREWALANGYSAQLTLDRIDNDKGYSPANCRWATYHVQRMNQRRMKR